MDDNFEAESVAQKILFSELADVFDKICNTVKSSKQFVFNRFLRRWREEMAKLKDSSAEYEFRADDTFFPALRLFAPSKDATRDFRIKEAKLNHLVCKTLLTKALDSVPTTDLLVEKLVGKATQHFGVIQPKLSIADVNDYLDRMKWPANIVQQENAMSHFVRQCTENELRYILHIILGNIEHMLGVSGHVILEWFHPGMDTLWKEGNSLQQLCGRYADDDAATGPAAVHEGDLLCKPFRPMLLKRLNYNKYCLPKIIKACQRPFYAEVKYDGEHFLVHRYEFIHYKYFTRNGIDYTYKMGPTNESFISKRIHSFFRPEVRDCVLDCELLIWDCKKQSFIGKNKRASDGNVYDPKNLDDDFFDNHPLLVRSLAVFDLLYVNGECLVKKRITLRERLELLGKILQHEDRSVIFISPKELINKADQLSDFYKKAMHEGEEGIVVKALNSLYRAGSRAEKNGWFKIKPDYGIQSVLDLAVVGVRFENASLENVKSFLVAARLSGRANQLRFKVVAGITSKLKKLDYQRLRSTIGETEELLEATQNWLELDETKYKKYDRYVPRNKIQIVEVRASGLINGALQFPSIVSIRNDKLLDEIDSVEDVLHFDERLRSRPMIDETDAHEAIVQLNRRKRFQFQLSERDRLVKCNATERNRYSRALRGKKVCVLNASREVGAHELQKVLIGFGATPVANPTSDTAFLVAMNPKLLTCVAQIKANKLHIVHGNWLLRCKDQQTLLPWQDTDMMHNVPNAPFDLFTLPEMAPEEEEEHVEEAEMEQEEQTDENHQREESSSQQMEKQPAVKTEQNDQEDGTSEANVTNVALAQQQQQQDMVKLEIQETETTESDARFDMTRLAEEAEREERQIGAELLPQMSGSDCQPAESGNLFADYVFFLHESVHRALQRRELLEMQHQIESQNGRISEVLDDRVTHVILDRMKNNEEKPLFEWNDRQQWLGQFVSLEWIQKAIEEEDRYRLPVRINEFIEY